MYFISLLEILNLNVDWKLTKPTTLENKNENSCEWKNQLFMIRTRWSVGWLKTSMNYDLVIFALEPRRDLSSVVRADVGEEKVTCITPSSPNRKIDPIVYICQLDLGQRDQEWAFAHVEPTLYVGFMISFSVRRLDTKRLRLLHFFGR